MLPSLAALFFDFGFAFAQSLEPGAGEAADVAVLADANSAWWEQGLAGVSLIGSVLSGGTSPNIGPLLRSVDGPIGEISEGIYEFVAASGKIYVGQSGDIPGRLRQHLASGKPLADDISSVRVQQVLGGRVSREVAEQRRTDAPDLGGIQNLENLRNPIGPGRQHLLQ